MKCNVSKCADLRCETTNMDQVSIELTNLRLHLNLIAIEKNQ